LPARSSTDSGTETYAIHANKAAAVKIMREVRKRLLINQQNAKPAYTFSRSIRHMARFVAEALR